LEILFFTATFVAVPLQSRSAPIHGRPWGKASRAFVHPRWMDWQLTALTSTDGLAMTIGSF